MPYKDKASRGKYSNKLAGADSLINKTEFTRFLNEHCLKYPEVSDIYSRFNYWLKLGEKWADPKYRKEE